MSRKRVLVVGGSSGIGGAVAEALILEGHCVGIVSRRPVDAWDWRTPDWWNAEENALCVDLRQPTRVQTLCSNWAGDCLDGLIFSAVDYGGQCRKPILELELTAWQSVVETNVIGFSAVVASVLPALLQAPSGVLINVSSETAFNPAPGRAPYGASKAAQRHILRSLSEELRPGGLSIVEMLPEGMVRSPGIERRRPANYDWSGYASPRSFCRFVCEILEREHLGSGYHVFVVDGAGQARRSTGNDLRSQSRVVDGS